METNEIDISIGILILKGKLNIPSEANSLIKFHMEAEAAVSAQEIIA